MGTKSCQKDTTRIQILRVGLEIVMEKGYNNTGLQEILDKAGVPKGSFYHYFPSKEEFGLAIIDHFSEEFATKILSNLHDTALSPLARLKAYCQASKAKIESWNCRRGCLVGNLSQEMADQSEILRLRLEQIFHYWRDLLTNCISEGQAIGEIQSLCPAQELADLFLSGWEGAIMRAKAMRVPEPMEVFMRVMFDHVLTVPSTCGAGNRRD